MSTSVSNITAVAPEVSTNEKPVRRVVSKRIPKATAAANASTEATPASVAPASAPVADSETAPAATSTKKRAPRKTKATPSADAAAIAVESSVADAKPAEAAGEAASADAAPVATPVKRVRIARPPRVFIVAFGDLTVEEKDRSFSKEEFESWKAKTLEVAQNIRYKEWSVMKRKYYQTLKKQSKGKKRVSKGYNWEATAENHLQRLKDMPAEKFAELDGVWLSNYQFTGQFDAAQLAKDGCPERGAIPTFTVYLAAIFHGYKPAGIVSENGTRNGTEISFTTTVDGKREYVGVALPFQNKERSQYSVLPKDRVPAAI